MSNNVPTYNQVILGANGHTVTLKTMQFPNGIPPSALIDNEMNNTIINSQHIDARTRKDSMEDVTVSIHKKEGFNVFLPFVEKIFPSADKTLVPDTPISYQFLDQEGVIRSSSEDEQLFMILKNVSPISIKAGCAIHMNDKDAEQKFEFMIYFRKAS
jgi:hypothetical protein